jgi:hypothetical protein
VDEPQSIWVIRIDQPEYPGKFVVHRYEIPVREGFVADLVAVTNDLQKARAHLPPGLVKAIRNEQEGSDVVEMWMLDPFETRH